MSPLAAQRRELGRKQRRSWMKLFFLDGSPFARIVRVIAREHAIELAETEIDEFPPPESFLTINPLGQQQWQVGYISWLILHKTAGIGSAYLV